MTSILAATRPSDWNFPLVLHVLGAMILVGSLLTGASALAYARGEVRLLKLGYWTLLIVGLPGYVLMRIGGDWTYEREYPGENPPEPTWLQVGWVVADLGAILLLVALVLGGIGVRRLRAGKGTGLLKATMVISLVLLAAYVVAVWAMSAKPD